MPERIHLSGEGVPAVTVAIPARYIHSPVSVMSLADFDLHGAADARSAAYFGRGFVIMAIPLKELIKNLVETYGPSGREDAVRAMIQGLIREKVDETRVDALGNLIALKKGTGGGKKVMVAAHMDEIGLMVTYVDKKGFPALRHDRRRLLSYGRGRSCPVCQWTPSG